MNTSLLPCPATPRSPSEEARIDQAMLRYADGDRSAFAELFSMLEPRQRRQLHALCRCRELARELTQETFLRIHRARGSFARGLATLPWAHAVARNCYLSHVRAWSSRLSRASVDPDQCELRAEAADDAEACAIARETARMLDAALAELPRAQRDVVRLRADGHSIGAVAKQLGLSEGAVKLRSFRSSRRLRRALRRAAGPGSEGPGRSCTPCPPGVQPRRYAHVSGASRALPARES